MRHITESRIYLFWSPSPARGFVVNAAGGQPTKRSHPHALGVGVRRAVLDNSHKNMLGTPQGRVGQEVITLEVDPGEIVAEEDKI